MQEARRRITRQLTAAERSEFIVNGGNQQHSYSTTRQGAMRLRSRPLNRHSMECVLRLPTRSQKPQREVRLLGSRDEPRDAMLWSLV